MISLSEHSRITDTQRDSERQRTSLEQINDVELTDEVKRAVMSSCNVRSILESWGCNPVLGRNNEWQGFCPDHVIHDGHRQHLPKWFMNGETGDCICFTSSKKSNFIYVARRMWNLPSLSETIRILTNGETISLPPPEFIVRDEEIEVSRKNEEERIAELKKGISLVKRLLDRGGHLSDKCLEYFANDGITKETLDFFNVCSMESGYLEGRAIIPFIDSKKEFCGYVAVNYMGKEWWVKRQYNRLKKVDSKISYLDVQKSYRKTLYCPGFLSRNHLYGLYEALNGYIDKDLVIVEGERDAMKLLQEGIDCVSIHGTSLKDEQIPMIKSLVPKTLYLGFDMDKPGRTAAEKAFKLLKDEVDRVKILEFPDGKDPKKFNRDELLKIMGQ